MKRRNILLGGAAMFAAPVLNNKALAQTADASRLKTDLTPFGAERAASKSGLVPAWTGGASTPPAGWQPGTNQPNLFPNQQPLFTVTAENMSQYSAMLSEGQQQLLKRFGAQGFKILVYPSARTACAPQYIYDATAANVSRAQGVAKGLLYGVTGAIGGPAFPILSDDPSIAGMQAIWNHKTRWKGLYYTANFTGYVISNGHANITASWQEQAYFPYSDPKMTVDNYNNVAFQGELNYTQPANQAGAKYVSMESTANSTPNLAYEYLVGEGRIRQAPDAEYDIPSVQQNDALDIDEDDVFFGPIDRYDWKLVGKKEMIIPYNVYDFYHAQPAEALGPHFIKPELLRHEVHRCWVVEAHLRAGSRMSEPTRRFYIDEDSWAAVAGDSYDAQGNYWKHNFLLPFAAPSMPGLFTFTNIVAYNFQANEYVTTNPWFDAPAPQGGVISFAPVPRSTFDPQSMANSGGL